MNKNQRDKNRKTARWLENKKVCQQCGERGNHRFPGILTPLDLVEGRTPEVFWSCRYKVTT